MSKGSAGYLWSLSFDDGSGHQVMGVMTSDFNPAFETVDTTETQQAAEDTTLTLQRNTVTGEMVYEEAADDAAKGDFITAYFAGTECEILLVPAGTATGTNRTFTFNALITALSLKNNGPAGVSGISFTLRNSDGGVVSVGTVS